MQVFDCDSGNDRTDLWDDQSDKAGQPCKTDHTPGKDDCKGQK